MIRVCKMGEFVKNNVFNAFHGSVHQGVIEGQDTALGHTGAPSGFHMSKSDLGEGRAEIGKMRMCAPAQLGDFFSTDLLKQSGKRSFFDLVVACILQGKGNDTVYKGSGVFAPNYCTQCDGIAENRDRVAV